MTMRNLRFVPLVAVGLLAAAAPARAQNFCYGGQLWTCFSYQLTVTPFLFGSDVKLSIRNQSAPDPTGQASWMTALAIYSPASAASAFGLNVSTTGTVGAVGSPGSQWVLSTPPPSLGLPGAVVLANTGGSDPKQGNISGCGLEGGATIYFNTCAPNTGWVVFDFKTVTPFTGTFDMGAKWQTALGSFECTTGAPSKSTPSCSPPGQVTPEPVTMALLGTGLFGIGMAKIRRRKKNGDVENI